MKTSRVVITARPDDMDMLRAIAGQIGPVTKSEIYRRGLRALTKEIFNGTHCSSTKDEGHQGKASGHKGSRGKGASG